jgi:hypothetical protein
VFWETLETFAFGLTNPGTRCRQLEKSAGSLKSDQLMAGIDLARDLIQDENLLGTVIRRVGMRKDHLIVRHSVTSGHRDQHTQIGCSQQSHRTPSKSSRIEV